MTDDEFERALDPEPTGFTVRVDGRGYYALLVSDGDTEGALEIARSHNKDRVIRKAIRVAEEQHRDWEMRQTGMDGKGFEMYKLYVPRPVRQP